MRERVVVSGIGLVTSVGLDRETTWSSVQRGVSRARLLSGIADIPADQMIGAVVELDPPQPGMLKVIPMCLRSAGEALYDAAIDWRHIDSSRFGCSISAHMGDAVWLASSVGRDDAHAADRYPWLHQWLPNSACAHVARVFGLHGPRLVYSTACASSLISVLSAVRALRDGQCDLMLAGGGDAIHPLFAAGFQRMGVLAMADDPATACRPFDRHRCGFVMGEGAAMLVLETESHALARGARIYAEILDGHVLAEAHHVTGVDAECAALCELLRVLLFKCGLPPHEVGYINAHGTGTEQNDRMEMRAIGRVFGAHCRRLCVSGTKSMLGHMVNAAGAAELAVTLLAMRDGFVPPTINVTDPDPECVFDCLPRAGRTNRFQHAVKLSVAFGGHLVAVALRRWNDPATGFAYPVLAPPATVARAA